VLESLIKAGAYDGLGAGQAAARWRPHLMGEIDPVMARSAKIREDVQSGQDSLFEWKEMAPGKPPRRARPSDPVQPAASAAVGWSEHELLGSEKEVLGFYLSGHPLARFQSELNLFSTHRLDNLPAGATGTVRLAGMISNVRRLVTKAKKEPYARARFEDLHGEVDLVIFPRAYAGGLSQHLKPNAMMVVSGRLNRRPDEGGAPEVLVEDMVPLSQAREKYVSEMLVRMAAPGVEEQTLEELRQTLTRYPGRCRVCFEIDSLPSGTVIVETDLTVKPSQELFQEIERRLGHECWRITRIGR